MRECIWDDCNRTDLKGLDGWCDRHYKWMLRKRRSEVTLRRSGDSPGDPDKPTKCVRCGEVRPQSEFWLTGGGHVRSTCKPCMRATSRAYQRRKHAEDPEFRRRSTDRSYRHNYGITLADYEQMIAACNGLCHLCGRQPPKGKLHVDHDHATGVTRGLLCWRCNVGLGFIEKMAPGRDFAAVFEYLQRGDREERAS